MQSRKKVANHSAFFIRQGRLLIMIVLLLGGILAACGGDEAAVEENNPLPSPTTEALAAVSATTVPAEEPLPTWTSTPQATEDLPEPTAPPPATNTPIPTSTEAMVTATAEATATGTAEPTAPPPATNTPAPVNEAPTTAPQPTTPPEPQTPPTLPPEPVLGVNLLPNGSFEEGHYNQNGVPELQLPNGWRLEWDEGPTGFGEQKWDVYVRPEARVLSTAFLPPEEHNIYIYNGSHTVKIFKGQGAVSFRLLTDVTLQPGTYVIEAKMFADVVQEWENKQKVWPLDPTAAEFRFVVGDGGTNWTQQRFGQINVHNWTFTVDQPETIKVGIWLRGKYAIANNGWFIDDLSLRRVE